MTPRRLRAYNAACAEAVTVTHGETLWFPAGTCISVLPAHIQLFAANRLWKCASEGACTIQAVSEGIFPIIMHEGNGYVNGITTQGPGFTYHSQPGQDASLNWGANSQQYYDLKDAVFAISPTGWGNAKPINGQSALSIEGFFNYAGSEIRQCLYPRQRWRQRNKKTARPARFNFTLLAWNTEQTCGLYHDNW